MSPRRSHRAASPGASRRRESDYAGAGKPRALRVPGALAMPRDVSVVHRIWLRLVVSGSHGTVGHQSPCLVSRPLSASAPKRLMTDSDGILACVAGHHHMGQPPRCYSDSYRYHGYDLVFQPIVCRRDAWSRAVGCCDYWMHPASCHSCIDSRARFGGWRAIGRCNPPKVDLHAHRPIASTGYVPLVVAARKDFIPLVQRHWPLAGSCRVLVIL